MITDEDDHEKNEAAPAAAAGAASLDGAIGSTHTNSPSTTTSTTSGKNSSKRRRDRAQIIANNASDNTNTSSTNVNSNHKPAQQQHQQHSHPHNASPPNNNIRYSHSHSPSAPHTPTTTLQCSSSTPPAKRSDGNPTPPNRPQYNNIQQSQQNQNQQNQNQQQHQQRPPAAMTVLVCRCDLFDSGPPNKDHTQKNLNAQNHHLGGEDGNPTAMNPTFSTPPPTSTTTPSYSYHVDAYPRPVGPYYWYYDHHDQQHQNQQNVAVVRVPPAESSNSSDTTTNPEAATSSSCFWMQVDVMDKSQPVPASLLQQSSSQQQTGGNNYNTDPNYLAKYWYQRRRLFHKFDAGIQLDEESWFSVSPEQIADHVSNKVWELFLQQQQQHTSSNTAMVIENDKNDNSHSLNFSNPTTQEQEPQQQNIVLLDAFCGCGGNAISFAKCLPDEYIGQKVQIVAVDLDRSKLRRAAWNAHIYNIPRHKIVFVECNVLFLLEHAYENGHFVLDRPCSSPEAAMALLNAMPPPVAPTELVQGYSIGGLDLLPRTISLAHLDPPWGGVEYQILGKNGYDLQRNMKIQRSLSSQQMPSHHHSGSGCSSASGATPPPSRTIIDDGTLQNDFFDSFCSFSQPMTKNEKKALFNNNSNSGSDESNQNCLNGAELLALAAKATLTHIVSYDVPRNINRGSLGQAALAAGYRGNCKLEEQYLNGRLKTVTAYFGSDWSHLMLPGTTMATTVPPATNTNTATTSTTNTREEQQEEVHQC